MRYVTFSLPGDARPRLGVLQGEQIFEPGTYASLLDLIDAGPPAWKRVADQFKTTPAAGGRALEQVRLHAPIPRPRKNIFCLGLNYVSHMLESSAARGRQAKIPEVPVFFSKPPTTVN